MGPVQCLHTLVGMGLAALDPAVTGPYHVTPIHLVKQMARQNLMKQGGFDKLHD